MPVEVPGNFWLRALGCFLLEIERADHEGDYEARYEFVLEALMRARKAGLQAGIGIDQSVMDMPGFRVVVYIELPELGQVSWHMPEHGLPWDGHSTREKYERIRQFAHKYPL